MKGQIAITEITVKNNKMGWSVFDFFKRELKKCTDDLQAGWYAYKLEGDIYYFKWTDFSSNRPSDKYLNALKGDGWILGIQPQTIEDAFK